MMLEAEVWVRCGPWWLQDSLIPVIVVFVHTEFCSPSTLLLTFVDVLISSITEEMFAVTGDGSSHQYNRPGRPDCVAIFLHQIETGLIRIHVNGDWTKFAFRSYIRLHIYILFGDDLLIS